MAYIYPGLVFIHIPKTGGTSVWWHLEQVGGWQCKNMHSWKQHETATQFDRQCEKFRNKFCKVGTDAWRETIGNKQKMALEYADYEKFAIVRNPFARAVSIYTGAKFRRNNPKVWTPTLFSEWLGACHHSLSWRLDKSEILGLLGAADRKFSPFRQQCEFVKGDVRVFRTEEFDKLWDWLIPLTGPSAKTYEKAQGIGAHYLKGRPGHYREFYNHNSRDMIERLCRDDLDRWGWEF